MKITKKKRKHWIPNQVGDDNCMVFGDDNVMFFGDDSYYGFSIKDFEDDRVLSFRAIAGIQKYLFLLILIWKKAWILDKDFEDDIYYGFLLSQKRHPPPLS